MRPCGPCFESSSGPINVKDLDNGIGRLAGGSLCAFKKKLDPFFPDSLGPDTLQEIVTTLAVSLEVKAQV